MKLCFLASIEDNHSRKWIRYFIDKGYEVHWISLPSVYIKEAKGAKIYLIKDFSSKSLDIIFNTLSVKNLIREINPDIIHAHYVGVNGLLGALSGFHPFILTAFGSDVLINSQSKIKKFFIKFSLNKTNLITCDGENTKEEMINFGIDSKKIKIIYFGVDPEKFKKEPKDENLKEKLNLSGSPIVISLRMLKEIYNLETLIRAIPVVLKEVPETKFIIAGEGDQKQYLINLAESLNISEMTKFVGHIPHNNLPRYLNLADIYVSTSLSDGGLAVSTAEAMACGLPVIITDSGDNKKWVKDGENGFIIPVKNQKLLAEKIIYSLRNQNAREMFGMINQKIIEEKYNYYKEMSKAENLYKELIKI